MRSSLRYLWAGCVFCVLLPGLLLPVRAGAERILHEQRSLYTRLVVKQTGTTICLLFNTRRNQRNQSCVNTKKPKELVFTYTRMSMTSLLFVPEPSNILIVGVGGGTLPMAFADLHPQANIDAIEIDPAVVKVAKQYFGLTESERLRVFSQDARVWTKRAMRRDRRYDIIILDAYNGEYIPEHLMTREYLDETRLLLAPAGVLIANTFAISDLYHHESTTYAEVFGKFVNFRLPESANRVVIAPGVHLADDLLRSRAKDLKAQLKPLAVPILRYAELIIRARHKAPNWNTAARVLTDQYSPANLLQSR